MEGSRPNWATTEDYATLEEVFTSGTFGKYVPDAPVVAAPVAAVVATGPNPDRNRVIGTFAAAAAVLSVVAALTFGTGPGMPPVISAERGRARRAKPVEHAGPVSRRGTGHREPGERNHRLGRLVERCAALRQWIAGGGHRVR